ncbi:MAG: hypothetical protein DRJ64_02130 [Thermoprotei archaeon]|nr:MAG: hypothetical protein DRJ64_02130 [Thermoprotei archaeon]
MKKFPHKLKENKTTQLPRRLFFIDTETYGIKGESADLEYHKLRLGVCCCVRYEKGKWREKWLTFRDNDTLFDFIENNVHSKERAFIFAHNFHFDWAVIDGFNQLKKRGWNITKWIIDSQVFIIKARKDNRSLVFLDSGNIIKTKLEKLGEVLGIEKLKVDFDTVDDKELEIYCKRDVEILKEFILKWIEFIKIHDLGSFKLTLASQSFTAFRHRFMKHEIFVHARDDVIALERMSYRGGRSEAFFIGEIKGKKFYLLDVNSMYPYVMKEKKYPIKLISVLDDVSIDKLRLILKHYLCVAHVRVKIDEPAIGVKRDKLIFPVGEFDCVLTTDELKYLLKTNSILKVYRVAIYEGEYIFRDYVDYFYNLKRKYKEEGNKVFYQITKLFLNSLYGKFGQRNESFKVVGEYDGDYNFAIKYYDSEEKKWYYDVYLDGKIYRKEGYYEAFDSFVAVASHVTAYARMYLWRLMKIAGLDNVYYVDTDSLLVNEEGFKRLKDYINDYELGKLKLEFETDYICIRGVKDYNFKFKNRIKGIKENAIKIDDNTYIQKQFLKTRSLLNEKISGVAVVKNVTKKLKRKYDKGIVTESGRVIPFPLPQAP